MGIKNLSKIWLLIFLIAFLGGCSKGKVNKNTCDGVTCSSHGTCAVVNGLATCNCNTCYVADKLECNPDPSACSGHGMCVDNSGTPTCQCDDGYHAEGWVLLCCEDGYHLEGLSCIKNVPTCLEGCNVDDDCLFGNSGYSFDDGHLCDPTLKRCVECTQDDQCIAFLSGWWNPSVCSTDEDCTTSPQKCIMVASGEGRCVSQAQDCSKLGYGFTLVSKTDINGTDSVSVCAITNPKCVSGNCTNKECGSNADCVAKYNGWLLGCSNNADCNSTALACVYLTPNETNGYCALIPDPTSGCILSSLTQKALPLFENKTTNVTVCINLIALANATCNNGTCMNPCKVDSDCSNQPNPQPPYCDASTGRCICKNDTDCTTNADKCFAGSCGCSLASICTGSQLKNITWECITP